MIPARPPGLAPIVPIDGAGAVVTLGTFDGVHLGHQEVVREVVRRARTTGRRSVVVTFDPHPLRIVRPEAAPPLLSTTAEKKILLAGTGIEYVVILRFTPELQQYSARRFVEEILLGRLGMAELVIGHDHGFGRGREGSVETMQALGGELGLGVDVVSAVQLDEQPVSSTRVRAALDAGDIPSANRCLGWGYSAGGVVIHGEHKGRELGFPTANIRLDSAEKLLPAEGIYAVYGRFRGRRLPGLLHLGPRPTFPGYAPSVELYLLDWTGDLYGEAVEVEFERRLRGILPFEGAEALVTQMRQDEAEARVLFGR